MGKDKHGLIEDRVIRNPMEQMRRKQKLKEKEKRKEQREHIRDQQIELFKQREHIDPLKTHDFSMINQIKEEEARKMLGEPVKISGKATGVMTQFVPKEARPQVVYHDEEIEQQANQEQQNEGVSWQDIQNNYMRQLQGYDVDYSEVARPQAPQEQTFKPQPYMRKEGQPQGDQIVSQGQPVIHRANQQKPASAQVVQASKQTDIKPQQIKRQQPKHGIDLNDPLDPSFGDKNHRDKNKPQQKQEEVKQPDSKFAGVSSDIINSQ